jgi:hypothetical protein
MTELDEVAGERGDLPAGKTTQVRVGYTSAYPDALVVRRGARLTVEPRLPAYPGWVWCRDPDGTGAWVPEAFLEITSGVALINTDYDSTELTVEPGDSVQVLRIVAGWAWCRHGDDRHGWLPVGSLAEKP